jgi:hypothetical protein
MAGAFGVARSHIGDGASVRAATRVNAEQSSKWTMCRPTRQRYRGRLTSGVWKRSHGSATKAPPDEGAGTDMAQPNVTAPQLDSTISSRPVSANS